MPSILIEGFQFQVFPGDHLPPHVHVFRGSGRARVVLLPMDVEDQLGFKRQELAKIFKLAREHRATLLAMWEEVNGDA